jgi:hypothetical protein
MLKVKDEVKLTFDIVARSGSPGQGLDPQAQG